MRIAVSLSLLVGLSGFGVARAEPPADRVASYEGEAVGVRPIVPLWDAFQGHDHHPIDEKTFFRIVGREDLVRRFEHRAVLKKSLMAGGGVAIVGGAMYSLVTFLSGSSQPGVVPCPSPGCPPPSASSMPNPAWGLVGIGTGLASILVGHFLNPSPIGAAEADQMARDHDEHLKADLGLSDVSSR